MTSEQLLREWTRVNVDSLQNRIRLLSSTLAHLRRLEEIRKTDQSTYRYPVGRGIVSARLMDDATMDAEAWSVKPVVLVLEDGATLYPARDEEGNGPGAIFGRTFDGRPFTLLPTETGRFDR